jgi:aconitate hydratase
VRAVLAESFERIHRSNLVGMGVLPLQFIEGQNRESLALTGFESFAIEGIPEAVDSNGKTKARITATLDGTVKKFEAIVRIDTPRESEYYRSGGILPYVLRQLAAR